MSTSGASTAGSGAGRSGEDVMLMTSSLGPARWSRPRAAWEAAESSQPSTAGGPRKRGPPPGRAPPPRRAPRRPAPAMRVDDAGHDGQSQPRPAPPSLAASLRTPEALEELL